MDKPKCPYCGAEMEWSRTYYSGLMPGEHVTFWWECECGAKSPARESEDDAFAVAMRRWQEPNRVLALEEVLALPEGARVWVEHAKGYGKSHMYAKLTRWNGCDIALVDEDWVCWRIDTHIPETEFGKLYRVWSLPQPPTQEEMDANPWEVQSDG